MTTAIAPSIHKVTDDNGEELPNGASTSKTSVSVYGKTGVGQAGTLKNGDAQLADFNGDGKGHWEVKINVKVGKYEFQANSGDGTSAKRVLFVIES